MKKGLRITLIVIGALFAIIIIAAIFGEPAATPATSTQDEATANAITEQLKQDSVGLISYFNDNINMEMLDKLEIAEFNQNLCRIRVTIPDETGLQGADVVGKGCCILAARYLNERNYDIASTDFMISCWVYSPYKGVTGREGLVTQWGVARYDPLTDAVTWKWAAEK